MTHRTFLGKRTLRRWAMAAAALYAVLGPLEARAQSAPKLENDQIEIFYSPPQSSYLRPLYQRLQNRKYLEQLKQFLSPLILPAGTLSRWLGLPVE